VISNLLISTRSNRPELTGTLPFRGKQFQKGWILLAQASALPGHLIRLPRRNVHATYHQFSFAVLITSSHHHHHPNQRHVPPTDNRIDIVLPFLYIYD
jgi:hypothetical protein